MRYIQRESRDCGYTDPLPSPSGLRKAVIRVAPLNHRQHSAAGSCYDKAVVESFFASLKRARCKRTKYRTREDAKAGIFDYIERFYNRNRTHSYYGYVSPVQYSTKNKPWGFNQLVRFF